MFFSKEVLVILFFLTCSFDSKIMLRQKNVDDTDDELLNISISSLHIPCEERLKDVIPPEASKTNIVTMASDIISGESIGVKESKEVMCMNGFADGYPCENINLLSMLDTSALNAAIGVTGNINDLLNDIWGWTSFNGREFAIIGLRRGTAFVEITDTLNSVYLGVLRSHEGTTSIWRDIKTYENYAYIVAESKDHGIQIFDLNTLLTSTPNQIFSESAHYNGISNAHNLFINESTGYAYAVGAETCHNGLHIIDLSNSLNPTKVGCYVDNNYIHDLQCVIYKGNDVFYRGREICFACTGDTISIIDVTNKNDSYRISRMSKTNNKFGYVHQGWLTEDHNYFIFNDELDEHLSPGRKTATYIVNVMDLTNPQLVKEHFGTTTATDHNLYIVGDLIYEANYRAGLQVLQVAHTSNTIELTQVANFDIFPNSNSNKFNGAWSSYPFFPSGTVIVSGIEQGLFVLKVDLTNLPKSALQDHDEWTTITYDTMLQNENLINKCDNGFFNKFNYIYALVTRKKTSCLSHQRDHDLTQFHRVRVTIWFYTQNFLNIGKFTLSYSSDSGKTWNIIQKLTSKVSLEEEKEGLYTLTLLLDKSQVSFTANARLRCLFYGHTEGNATVFINAIQFLGKT